MGRAGGDNLVEILCVWQLMHTNGHIAYSRNYIHHSQCLILHLEPDVIRAEAHSVDPFRISLIGGPRIVG